MSWLLDTDVICQPAKKKGDPKVIAWLEAEQDRSAELLTVPAVDVGFVPCESIYRRDGRCNHADDDDRHAGAVDRFADQLLWLRQDMRDPDLNRLAR